MNNVREPELKTPEAVLADFYVDYAAWIDAGVVDPHYSETLGLCANLCSYCLRNGHNSREAVALMVAQFVEAGLDEYFPFNNDGAHYILEGTLRVIHRNERRITWVRAHLPPSGTVV